MASLDVRLVSGKQIEIATSLAKTVADVRRQVQNALALPTQECLKLVTSAGAELDDASRIEMMSTGVTTVIILYAKLQEFLETQLARISGVQELATLRDRVELDCSHHQLAMLPESIGQLTALQFLRLDGNQLTTLPESIGQLTALQDLWLQHNQLTTLPESIVQLTALQILRLEGNQLTTLPESIGQLTALQKLWLNDNQLTTLPESIGQLTALQCFFFHHNQLTTLPESMKKHMAIVVTPRVVTFVTVVFRKCFPIS